MLNLFIALDPAGPCFRNLPNEERLNPDAAERVDVVHTNIDGFGIADTMGHVDFYVNGALFSNFILPCFQLCSHVLAAVYWALSFSNPDKFIAVQCDTVADARLGNCFDKELKTNVLGPKTNFSQPGIYYLPTSEAFPYFMGEEGLKKRKYGANNYLLKPAPDVDIVI
ncbi:putative lipase [Operophtera brumata]|uniref:Putative lipase n=1 Tax=Operophtera brumata TaxID=104452 RepID=A0A0L7LKN2_OPEBR|nr:putative lipase [Operophtera brumata]